jgi:limonene-1,2-epoxide hydrolase
VLSSRLIPAVAYRKTSVDAVMKDTFRDDVTYRNPGLWEWTRMKATITLLLRTLASENASWDSVNLNAAAVGFDLERIENKAQRYLVLIERAKQRRGAGVYFFKEPSPRGSGSRESRERVLVIQTPHAIYDRFTGPIGRYLFDAKGAILCANTAPRYADKSEKKLSDLAHNPGSFFQAVNEAICDYYEKALIVQIHGFDRSKTETERKDYECVLSDGTPNAAKNALVREMASRLRGVFGPSKVAVFGDDVDELGATTNVQGKYINQHSDDLFLHIELSAGVRKALTEDAKLRKRFIEAFK